MIYGNKYQGDLFEFLDEKLCRCIKYMQTLPLNTMTLGIHEIEGKDFYVNVCEYMTQEIEERVWESHRSYIDVHYAIKGAERMDISLIERMNPGIYDPEKDLIIHTGEAAGNIILGEGDFLICYPQDVHRTAVKVNEPALIRKAIFKIKI